MGEPPAPTLREVQARLFALITAREGVAESLPAAGLTPADLERWVRSDAKQSAVEQLNLYAGMYFFRIRDVLAELLPASLSAGGGKHHFHNLVTAYLEEHPSNHPSLRNVGERLPGFLASAGDPERPWLAELAALEWARHDLFDGPDAEPLTLERLRSLHPDAFGLLPLRAHSLPPETRTASRDRRAVAFARRGFARPAIGPARAPHHTPCLAAQSRAVSPRARGEGSACARPPPARTGRRPALVRSLVRIDRRASDRRIPPRRPSPCLHSGAATS